MASGWLWPTWRGDLGSEWWARDVFVSELDDDVVLSGSCWDVDDGTGAIFVVGTLDLCLRWSLDGQTEATSTGILGYDGEVGRLPADTVAEAGSVGCHEATVNGIHVELEWTS